MAVMKSIVPYEDLYCSGENSLRLHGKGRAAGIFRLRSSLPSVARPALKMTGYLGFGGPDVAEANKIKNQVAAGAPAPHGCRQVAVGTVEERVPCRQVIACSN